MRKTIQYSVSLILIILCGNSAFSQCHFKTSKNSPIQFDPNKTCEGPWFYEYTDSKGRTGGGGPYGIPYKTEAIAEKRREADIKEGHALNKFFNWQPGEESYWTDNYSSVYSMPQEAASYENDKDLLASCIGSLSDRIAAWKKFEALIDAHAASHKIMIRVGKIFANYSNLLGAVYEKAREIQKRCETLNASQLAGITNEINGLMTEVETVSNTGNGRTNYILDYMQSETREYPVFLHEYHCGDVPEWRGEPREKQALHPLCAISDIHGNYYMLLESPSALLDGDGKVISEGVVNSERVMTDDEWSASDKCILLKTNSIGAPLWARRYKGPANHFNSSPLLIAGHDDNILLIDKYRYDVGKMRKALANGTYQEALESYEGSVLRNIDANGEELWALKLRRAGITDVKIDEDDNIIIAGRVTWPDLDWPNHEADVVDGLCFDCNVTPLEGVMPPNNVYHHVPGEDEFIAKVSNTHHILWSKTNTSEKFMIDKLVVNEEGNIYAAGRSYTGDMYIGDKYNGYNIKLNFRLMKCDRDGNVLWNEHQDGRYGLVSATLDESDRFVGLMGYSGTVSFGGNSYNPKEEQHDLLFAYGLDGSIKAVRDLSLHAAITGVVCADSSTYLSESSRVSVYDSSFSLSKLMPYEGDDLRVIGASKRYISLFGRGTANVDVTKGRNLTDTPRPDTRMYLARVKVDPTK